MKKLIFSFILILFFSNISYGQLKVLVKVYQDSTLSSYVSNVRIKLTSGEKRYRFKKKSLGTYEILVDSPNSICSIEIKKKFYMGLILEKRKGEEAEYYIKVILKKAYGSHDPEKYEGESKVVSIEKIEYKKPK
jgi:hypothetical protein